MSTILGQKIKNLRTIHGLTQDEMAKQLNINRASLSNWEIGRATPDVETLINIANFFDVTVDQLLLPDNPFKTFSDTAKKEQFLIGERVKQRRLLRNFSQQDLARILKKPVETIIKLERNNTPTGEILYESANMLAICLQAPLGWLMGMSDSPWFVPPLPETFYFGHTLKRAQPIFDITNIPEDEMEVLNLIHQKVTVLPSDERKRQIELTKAALKITEEMNKINQAINNPEKE